MYVFMCRCMYMCMYVCMYAWMNGWMDGWMDGLIVALCIFCLVLRKLCKPVKETSKRYKHIELSRNSSTGQRVFGQKTSPKPK